ncbi:hypothetical protein TSAR_002268 [Trichomalopsis sarcophagae]|uniref:Uncharacterized protein n=1 Tax=Trichomalopsis sarcophagae TaxID=543379 RepID=A0A232F9U6_9HYME|nr:hypothetical protein TSAR_002268 [Trichomalopsis sarcophagae]
MNSQTKEDERDGLEKEETHRSEASIHPSYTTGFLTFPYDVICRRRLARKKRRFAAQINREINHIIAMKMRAIDGIRLELLFTING